MKLGPEHIGKQVVYGTSEKTEGGVFLGRVAIDRHDKDLRRVVLEEFPGYVTTGHGGGDLDMGPEVWHLLEGVELPASIEPLMKEFGCHEKQTRALVAAILKEVKENTR